MTTQTPKRPLIIIVALTLALLTAACGGLEQPDVDSDEAIGSRESAAYIKTSSRWSNPGRIVVCWNDFWPHQATERAWVQDAVTAEYGNREAFWLNFVGWGSCATTSDPDIRIAISDETPHTEGLGDILRFYRTGMVLNFTFANWSTSCQTTRQSCIESIAVHEFGHAVGLAHEQNRPDTPTAHQGEEQGSDGDELVGAWDLSSLMNYENPTWNNGGTLSDLDVLGLHRLYVASRFETVQLFRDAYHKGRSSTFGMGRYYAHKQQLSVGNDAISSLKVPSMHALRLCQHSSAAGGSGTCKVYLGDKGFVGSFNDQASFAEVLPAAKVYQHASYGGMWQKLSPGIYRFNQGGLVTVGNDAISSIKVAQNAAVKLCTHEEGGSCKTYLNGTSFVGSAMNDQASRVEVIPAVTLHQHAYFAGGATKVLPGTTLYANQLSPVGNDAISSLRIPPGLKVTVCLHSLAPTHPANLCRTIGGDFGGTPFLGDDWNDQISYVRVDYI